MPTRSFGLVDFKVREADYFLAQLTRAARAFELEKLCFNTSAFVASSRSITFAMQAALRDHSDFERWYAPRQAALRASTRARFFHAYRTASQHLGENAVSRGSFSSAGALYYFSPISEPSASLDEDVVSACSMYFRDLLRLVYDCYVELAPLVNAQWRFTNEHFDSLELTIEDAEEEFGYPRGWTGSAGHTQASRWRMLRQEADGCGIEAQFETWLGLRLPHPDDNTAQSAATNVTS